MAGVAALHGHNPLEFLALDPEDAVIYGAAITEAGRLYELRERAFLDYLAAVTANRTTTGFSKVMRMFAIAMRGGR